MNDEQAKLLYQVAQQLADMKENQKHMHEENIARFAEDREERRKWRDGIDTRFDGIERRIAPIVLLHQVAVKGGTWVVAAVGTGVAAFKGWLFVKDHLK